MVDDLAPVLAAAVKARDSLYVTPTEAALLRETDVVVEREPTPAALQLAGWQPGQELLGLFMLVPKRRITLYAAPIERAGADPEFVMTHEMGHVFDFAYDHARVDQAVSVVADGANCTGDNCSIGEVAAAREYLSRVRRADEAAARDQLNPWGTTCPICLVTKLLGSAAKDMQFIATESALQHRIPVGLGGLIPVVRAEVNRAAAMMPTVAQMLPGRNGQVNELLAAVGRAQTTIGVSGTVLNVGQTELAYRAIDRAWLLASHAAWTYFTQGNPEAVTIT